MANFTILVQLLVLVLASANAHFLLNYPTSLGFNQNAEDNSPCGGVTVSFASPSNFHVGGDAIAITTLHPQSNVLYRATTDKTAAGNWSVMALIAEYGLGSFCEPALSVPASFAGSMGLLQVVQNAEDGVHYQCAAVNFVVGVSSSVPQACSNATGNSAAFVADSTLLPALGTAAPTASASKSVSSATSAPASKVSGAEEILGRAGWWSGVGGMLLMFAMFLW